ncbi:MAG: helix-turn-helix transcriptional regulator [Clostridia bacterium]|nr:helix-turn-helix transcriptional regulator [Clostridia bacterium]
MKLIGKRLKSCRTRCGYTQEELGRLLAVTPQAISKWENGHALPDVLTFAHIARVLGVSTDELLLGVAAML